MIGVDMNVSDAEKELAKLKKKIESIESQIKKTELNRKESEQKGIVSQNELDAEKEKLRELERTLKEIRDVSKDKSYSLGVREEAKGQIEDAKEAVKEQRERVRMLQTEYNKIYNSIDRYDKKLEELNNDLEIQKAAAGGMERNIAEGEARFRQMAEAAGVADQHIIDLNKELDQLSERQEELENARIGFGYKEYDENATRISNINKELKEYKKNLTEVASAEKAALPGGKETERKEKSQSRLNAYLEKSSSLYQKLSGMIGKTAEMSGVLQEMSAATTGKLSGMLQTTGTALGGFSAKMAGAVSAAAPYIAIILAVVAALKKLADEIWKFGQEATSSIISYMEIVSDFSVSTAHSFVELLKSIGKFGVAATKAISNIVKKSVDLVKRFNVFSKLSDTLKDKFKRLGSTIKSALVFSVIYKGLSLVREQVGKYLSVNTQFMTALRRLQGVLLTAFQPIYEIVVPALTTLINILSRAIATVTQFFASLFGKTAKQAQINAKGLYEQANATEAAGDAAEEASLQMAAFDEINKLEGNKSAGGGGGGGATETGPLFDFEYEDTPFDSWGASFSAFLDKLLDGIPKLRDAFKKFADWLNDFARKLYDMFTFPGVLDKVKQLGRELAEALNDLVNWIDWELLGRALGAGLNLALNFLTSFLYAFDWMNLGRKLAAFVNGLVDEIDWYEFGRLLWAGFKIAFETLAGFLTGLDMRLMAQSASKAIIGFFDEMKNTVNRIPWNEIGTQIAEFLNQFDWYGTIISMFEAISAGIMGLKEMVDNFLLTFDWRGTADSIARAVNEAIGLADWGGIGETIGYAIQEAFAFVEELISKINWYEIGEQIADFILKFDFAGALGGLADLIAAGINAAILTARGLLDKIMPEAENIAKDLVDRLKTAIKNIRWDELGGVIGDGIKTALKLIAGLLDPELFYEVGKAIGEFFINLDWPGIIGGLAEVLANGINAAVAAVKGFLEKIRPNLKQIAEDIAQKINEFVDTVDWKELGETIHDGIQAALDFLLIILDNLDWDSIGQAVVDFLSGLNWGDLMNEWGLVVGKAIGGALKGIDLSDALSIGANIVGGMTTGMNNKWQESGGILGWLKRKLFEPFINGFKSLFGIHSPSTVMEEQGGYIIEGLLQGISDTWHTITDFFSEKIEVLKKTLSDAWENIKKTASEKWESIKKTLGEKWDSIREAAKTKFEEIRKKVSEAWSNIRSDVPKKWDEIRTTLSTAWDKVKTTAGEKFGEVKDKIISRMDEVKEKDWYKTGKTIVDGILSGLESIWNSLTAWAGKVKDKISDALSGTNSRGGGFGTTGRSGGGRMAVQAVPEIAAYNVPALARGAVIPPNREFLAVLGDQKSGTNIETPLPTMIQAFKQALREAGMSGGSQTVILELEGRELGRAVVKFGGAEYQRIGTRLVEARA